MTDKEIIETQDGSHSVFSKKFGVSYHSKYGAIQESRHVFIEAGLYPKAIAQKKIDLLEIGLGTGLNAFLSLLEAEKRDLFISYTAVEAYPLLPEEAESLNYPELLQKEAYRSYLLKIHTSEWGPWIPLTPHFRFRKEEKRFEDIDEMEAFDLIYFDAFAPQAQPELWKPPLLSKMYAALRPGGVLVTYCAKGAVKRIFKEIGFEIEALKGPPGKREMTRCIKPNGI